MIIVLDGSKQRIFINTYLEYIMRFRLNAEAVILTL